MKSVVHVILHSLDVTLCEELLHAERSQRYSLIAGSRHGQPGLPVRIYHLPVVGSARSIHLTSNSRTCRPGAFFVPHGSHPCDLSGKRVLVSPMPTCEASVQLDQSSCHCM